MLVLRLDILLAGGSVPGMFKGGIEDWLITLVPVMIASAGSLLCSCNDTSRFDIRLS